MYSVLIWGCSYGIIPAIIFGFAGRARKLTGMITSVYMSTMESSATPNTSQSHANNHSTGSTE